MTATIPTQIPSIAPTTATLTVGGMKCAGCVQAVERQLLQQPGAIAACVNLITAVARVNYDPNLTQPETLAQKLTDRGFPSQVREKYSPSSSSNTPVQRQQKEQQEQLFRLITAAILLLFSGLGHWSHWGGPKLPILNSIEFHAVLATLALLFPGREIIQDGARGLWYKTPNMNTLVGLGTGSAYLASCLALAFPQWGWECFFDEPVMLLGFIFLGRFLEGRARGRASRSLEKLLTLQPPIAHLISQPILTQETGLKIPVEAVQVGEWVKVLPGEKIPVDGEISAGITTVDESMLTGESQPVRKEKGDRLLAGTFNLSGAIIIKVTHTATETTLAQIIALVETAQTRKAPIQKLADTIAGYFALGVMIIATLTFSFWWLWGCQIWPGVLMVTMGNHSLAHGMTSPLLLSLKLAIAVLVIACPCALGLATPTAILVGTSLGAERGILIKGGDILEQVGQLKTLVFDKTGTLTQGQPTVTDCLTFSEITPSHLLQIAATLESGSHHPLATGIIAAAKRLEIPLLNASDWQTEPGLGVVALVESSNLATFPVYLGNERWLKQHHITLPLTVQEASNRLAEAGKTVVYLAIKDEIKGLIALQDTLRPEAKTTIKRLQELGLAIVLLTGDRQAVAQAIAQQVGIDRVFSEQSPQQKAQLIRTFQEQGKVGMVGDGINDAPALAQADIGFALGGGTDIALETAGIVLMNRARPLEQTVEALQLSQTTRHKIAQNLFWALGYNAIALPIAAGVLLPQGGIILGPAMAGALMAFSSVWVVTNSLLLRPQFTKAIAAKI